MQYQLKWWNRLPEGQGIDIIPRIVDGDVLHWSCRVENTPYLVVKESVLGWWCSFSRGNLQRRMAQNRNRSNHVRVDNLPQNLTDCRELLSHLELGGNVQVELKKVKNR